MRKKQSSTTHIHFHFKQNRQTCGRWCISTQVLSFRRSRSSGPHYYPFNQSQTLSQGESLVFRDQRADVIALALKWERSQFITVWEKKSAAFRLQTDLGIHPEGNRDAFAAGGSLSLVEVFLKESSSERALRQTPRLDFTAHQIRGSAAACCGENVHHVVLLTLKETFESICRRVVSAPLCSQKENLLSSRECTANLNNL